MRIGAKKTADVSAGTMNRRVGVYAYTQTPDGEGGYTAGFTLQETIWGDFRPAKSNRTLLEQEKTFYQDAKVYVRYGLVINENYQLTIEDKTYTIQSINDVDNQHRYLEIILNG